MRTMLAIALIGGLGQISGGCGRERGLLEPEDVFGTYTLVSVHGEKVPVEEGVLGNGYLSFVVGGWLTLRSDLTYSRETTTRREYHGGTITTHVYEIGGTWEVHGVQKISLQDTSQFALTHVGHANGKEVRIGLFYESLNTVYRR